MPDALEAKLLYKMQKEFPWAALPFEAIGSELGISGAEALAMARRFKDEGLIRQCSAIFDSRALGYQSALVAASIDPGRIEEAAARVSAHPGVSHNYERPHAYNLWFTYALPPGLDYGVELARLAREAGLERTLALPSLRTFKIEVALDSSSEAGLEREAREAREAKALAPLGELDRRAVRLLQEDLSLCERPFEPMARELGLSEEGLFDWMAQAKAKGWLRRFAAILRHRKAGFSFNGMGVWKVPPDQIERCGRILASFKAVSHCYERPNGPDWPYNIFSMVHAKSAAECDEIFAGLSQACGVSDYQVLVSTREFKKVRLKYFLEGLQVAAI